MSASLDSIANITIDLQTSGVSQKNFGTVMVAGRHDAYAALAREYALPNALNEIQDDGIWFDSPIYRAVKSLHNASPKPEKVIIGRLMTSYTQGGQITVVDQNYGGTPGDVDPLTVYSFTVWAPPAAAETARVGTAVSVTAGTSATTTTVATAIAAAIDAITDITSTSTLGVVDWDADNSDEMWLFTGIDETLLVFDDQTPDSNLEVELGNIETAPGNTGYYGVVLADPNSNLRVQELEDYIGSKELIGGYTTHDGEVGDSSVTDDVMSTLQDLDTYRMIGIYSGDQSLHAMATWMGVMFVTDPGSATWNYKLLPSLTKDDLTSAFTASIASKGGNWYEDIGGLNRTQVGAMASGEWADVIRGRDWLVARLRERLATLLATNPKIPYTDGGIIAIMNEVDAQLAEGITQGYIAASPAPVVTAPRAAEVPSADKVSRILRNVRFTATLQGAIHKINVNGVLVA